MYNDPNTRNGSVGTPCRIGCFAADFEAQTAELLAQLGFSDGMLGGFLASVLWLSVFKAHFHGLYEAIPGFIAGFVLTWGVSRMTYRGD